MRLPWRASSTCALVFATSLWLLAGRTAFAADPVPSLDLRGFRAPTDPASGIYFEPAASPASFDWNVALWFNFVHRPIVLRDAVTDEVAFRVIRNQLTSDFTASIGIARRVALGFDFPFLLHQSGEDPTSSSRTVLGDTALPTTALGDLGLVAKVTLVPPTGGEFGGFALALHDRFTVPSGDDASFLGEGHLTNETRVLAEYRLVAVSVHGALGAKFRAEEEDFACADLGSRQTCPTRFGHDLPFGLALAVRPQAFGIDDKGRWTWFLETHGYLPLAPTGPFQSTALSSAQLGAGARLTIRDLSVVAGVETAMIGGIGNAPFRGVLSLGWAPRVRDVDNDGVEDDIDQCRELAEDRDLFQDGDGCPEGDNDDDGVPDGDDRCPIEKEDEDSFQDDDGCIDPDNDGDKVLDTKDACPNQPGAESPDRAKSGCPLNDIDGDGVEIERDKCPDQAEDKDGFEDDDGCPDPDNDGDGIKDTEDACPTVKGVDSPNAKDKGCPGADSDLDTLVAPDDKCPDKAENFNGLEDGDGCPEDKVIKPLVTIRETKDGPIVEMAVALQFSATHEIEPASVPLVRGLAVELLKHPEWTVAVGVRPSAKVGANESLMRAFAVVEALRRFTRKDAIAETVGWPAVKGLPGSEAAGIGWMILAGPKPSEAAKPEPAKPEAPKKPETPKKEEAKPPDAPKPPAPKP